ncbi:transcription factor IIF subunit [Martiniozyma asiatica (nom. inval.)]|nr:transcription factor IIF subunit [Martiniozyma asiatica]
MDANLELQSAHTRSLLIRLPANVEIDYEGQNIGSITLPNDYFKSTTLPPIKRQPEITLDDTTYTLRTVRPNVNNTFVFSERDLPTSERGTFHTQMAELPSQPKLQSLNKDTQFHEATWTSKKNEPDEEVEHSRQWTYARTIPKKTAIVGQVTKECSLIPKSLSNNRARLEAQKKILKGMVKRTHIKVVDTKEVGRMHGKATPNIQTGGSFALSKALARKKAMKEEGRHARLEKNELLEKILECFKEYEYWSLKNLKLRLKQPEQYLREILEDVAQMEKGGVFSQKWRLKDAYRKTIQAENSGFKKEEEEEEEDEDEDEDLDMEDVAGL